MVDVVVQASTTDGSICTSNANATVVVLVLVLVLVESVGGTILLFVVDSHSVGYTIGNTPCYNRIVGQKNTGCCRSVRF